MNRIKSILIMSALLLAGAGSSAVASDTIPAPSGTSVFEMMPLVCPLMGTSNPAALSFGNFSNINLAGAGFLFGEDDIKLVQQPEKTVFWNAETKGYMKLEKLSLFGSFGYSTTSYYGVMYNGTLMFDSYSPYILGDTVPSRQFKEQFDIQGKIGYPVTDRITLGAEVTYKSAVGAKVKDPRNKNEISEMRLSPGIILDLGKTRLGLSGSYYTTSDEIDYTVVGNDDHTFFLQLGLGYFKESVDVSYYSQWYTGTGYSGAFLAEHSFGKVNSMTEISYDRFKLETRRGSSFRLLDGITWTSRMGLNTILRIQGDRASNIISLKGYYDAANSDEIVQRSINVNMGTYSVSRVITDTWTENRQMISNINASLSYSYLTFEKDNYPDIDAGVSLSMQYFKTGYYPVQTNGYYSFLNVGGSLYIRKLMRIGSLLVTPGIEAGYRKNLSSDIFYTLAERSVPEMVYHDYYVSKADVISAGASVRLELPFSQNNFVKSLFFIPKGSWASAPGTEAGDLSGYMIRATAGITF
jgi:hypothetical protein